MKPVGYLISGSTETSPSEIGSFYNYRLAGNGLFIMVLGTHVNAQIPIAEIPVRGLPPAVPFIELKHGKIPVRLFDLAFSVMLASPRREVYVAVVWDGEQYSLRVPEQTGTGGAVEYQSCDNVVLDLHSHPGMPACFSFTDDKDEQGLRLYGVVGRGPEASFRVGVYGYFMTINPACIFDGPLTGIKTHDEILLEEG